MYELYRANFDSPNESMHVILPTRDGLYYFDETTLPATDYCNAVTNGHFTLEDYNLMPSTIDKTVMLLSVSSLHAESTPRMLDCFIRNNFLVTDLNLVMRYVWRPVQVGFSRVFCLLFFFSCCLFFFAGFGETRRPMD